MVNNVKNIVIFQIVLFALSSRTMIRKQLNDLATGQKDLEEVRAYTQPKYADGASVYTNLLYAVRRSSQGDVVAEYPPEAEAYGFGERDIAFSRNGQDCLMMIRNPIKEGDEEIGTDEAVFTVCHFANEEGYLVENLRVISEKKDSYDYPNLSLSLPVGNTGYYLYGEINKDLADHINRDILKKTLLESFLLIIIIILLSYITLMNQIKKLLRERQITQNQLARQEKQTIISQITAGIAHEINNVLTGILGLSELLRDIPGFPDEGKPYIREIDDSGRRAADFIRKLTDYNRQSIHSGKKIVLADAILAIGK